MNRLRQALTEEPPFGYLVSEAKSMPEFGHRHPDQACYQFGMIKRYWTLETDATSPRFALLKAALDPGITVRKSDPNPSCTVYAVECRDSVNKGSGRSRTEYTICRIMPADPMIRVQTDGSFVDED